MREGESLGSLRNIGSVGQRPTRLTGPKGILANDSDVSSDSAFATITTDQIPLSYRVSCPCPGVRLCP